MKKWECVPPNRKGYKASRTPFFPWALAKRLVRAERGALTIEAAVSVTLFSFLAMFLSSLFPMYMAQNAMAHALLQTAESLAYDSYATEQMRIVASSSTDTSSNIDSSLKNYARWDSQKTTGFTNTEFSWYRNPTRSAYADPSDQSKTASVVKDRFVHYLLGDNANTATLNQYLFNSFVEGGLSFSDSYVEDKVLYINLKYSYYDPFRLMEHLGIKPFQACQTACARLWIE